MLIGVDGTGPYFDRNYMGENVGSFVWQVVSQSRPPKLYFRGPDLTGVTCLSQAREVANLAKEWNSKFPHQKVFLTGHSRGGAICIEASRILKSAGVHVECLALFDAVKMELSLDVSVIPNNVKYACHAFRDSSVGSRAWWGNCGLLVEKPGLLDAVPFRTTHAGMGGTPGTGDHPLKRVVDVNQRYSVGISQTTVTAQNYEVPALTPEEERRGSQLVRGWMWGKMMGHGML